MMNIKKILSAALFVITFVFTACSGRQSSGVKEEIYVYKPDSQELYDTITRLSSMYWKAYNTCDMATQASFYSDSLEFYHDKGGLMTSKQDVLEGIKNNICDKVTRELVPASTEIYPISNYGAVEMGLHKFHNKLEPDAPSNPGRYIIIWQQIAGQWKMKRVISLH